MTGAQTLPHTRRKISGKIFTAERKGSKVSAHKARGPRTRNAEPIRGHDNCKGQEAGAHDAGAQTRQVEAPAFCISGW